MKCDFFLSYGHEDEDLGISVAVRLSEQGFRVWPYDYSEDEVASPVEAQHAFGQSRCVVVFIGRSARTLSWLELELGDLVEQSLMRDKLVVPIATVGDEDLRLQYPALSRLPQIDADTPPRSIAERLVNQLESTRIGRGSDLFARLELSGWRQFREVTIDFHPRLTILTGSNATGKSTILSLLGRHFNWVRTYSPAPVRVRSTGQWSNLGRGHARRLSVSDEWFLVGELHYKSGAVTGVSVPANREGLKERYDLLMPEQQQVDGVYLGSHRAISGRYTDVSMVPTNFRSAEDHFESFTREARAVWAGDWTGRSPQLSLKESLIAAAIFGNRNNESVEYSALAAEVWTGFQSVLKALMPAELGYRSLRVRESDVIVETANGDFILDEASGGLSAIVEIGWQVFLKSRVDERFTALIDEPENHLHPSLQREIMPSLLRAFPRVSFVVATHSPFVVSAEQDSTVIALDYREDRGVFSRQLDYANKAGTADEILRKVLGLASTTPIWAERRFSEVLQRHMSGSLSANAIRRLREDLVRSGLESVFPEALVQIATAEDDIAPTD